MISSENTTPPRRELARRPLAASAAAFAALLAALSITGAILPISALLVPAAHGQSGSGDAVFEDALWLVREPDVPSAGHIAIIDPERERMLVFGGESSPYSPPAESRALSLDGSSGWSTYETAGDPPVSALTGRGILGARAIVDASQSAAYMLCHCEGASVHRLDLETDTWSVVSTDTTKSFAHGLFAFDAEGDRALLFGGDPRDVGLVTSSAWALDLSPANTGWSVLPDIPFGLNFQAAGSDPATGHLLAFGGQDEGFVLSDALWRLDVEAVDGAEAWRRVPVAADAPWPPPRIGATLTFIEDTGQAILYGGYDAELVELDEVWHLDYSTPDRAVWSLLDSPGEDPGPRGGHSAVWYSAARDLIIYGGARTDGGEIRYLPSQAVLDLDPVDEPTPTATQSPTRVPPPTEPTPPVGDHFIYMPLTLRTHTIE